MTNLSGRRPPAGSAGTLVVGGLLLCGLVEQGCGDGRNGTVDDPILEVVAGTGSSGGNPTGAVITFERLGTRFGDALDHVRLTGVPVTTRVFGEDGRCSGPEAVFAEGLSLEIAARDSLLLTELETCSVAFSRPNDEPLLVVSGQFESMSYDIAIDSLHRVVFEFEAPLRPDVRYICVSGAQDVVSALEVDPGLAEQLATPGVLSALLERTDKPWPIYVDADNSGSLELVEIGRQVGTIRLEFDPVDP